MHLTVTDSLLFEKQLIKLGYKKYFQSFKGGDFTYWKSFEKNLDQYGEPYGGYQVGFTFYDFTKFPQNYSETPISINYEYILGSDMGVDKLNLTVTDDTMSIDKFEKFCSEFYHFWGKSKHKKTDLLSD
jgi:hypothetical protein